MERDTAWVPVDDRPQPYFRRGGRWDLYFDRPIGGVPHWVICAPNGDLPPRGPLRNSKLGIDQVDEAKAWADEALRPDDGFRRVHASGVV